MNMQREEFRVQRNYKDTVLRKLFRDKVNLLSLYNALNGTAYTEAIAMSRYRKAWLLL